MSGGDGSISRSSYAEGGALARQYGGWRVICWAVILALPVTLPVTIAAAVAEPARPVTAGAALGLAYVSLVSMCMGFFAWYQAMARGGVARIGRLQLAQPALTLLWSMVLLGERVSLLTGTAAVAVIAVTAVGRNARVDMAAADSQPAPHRAARSGSPATRPVPGQALSGQGLPGQGLSGQPLLGQPLPGQALPSQGPVTFMANTGPAAVSSSRSR